MLVNQQNLFNNDDGGDNGFSGICASQISEYTGCPEGAVHKSRSSVETAASERSTQEGKKIQAT
jgi:hypothetical protein